MILKRYIGDILFCYLDVYGKIFVSSPIPKFAGKYSVLDV